MKERQTSVPQNQPENTQTAAVAEPPVFKAPPVPEHKPEPVIPPPLEEEDSYIEEAPFVPPSASELPPLDELKPKILKALRDERHSLAAAMEKSSHWEVDGQTVTLSFNTPFESTFIEKESREIESLLKKSLGLEIHIRTVVKQIKEEALAEELDEQVQLVQNIFRGTLINRSK